MFFLVTLMLVTICDSTYETHLPEHPQKSYYKSQSSLTNVYHSDTTPRSKRLPDLFAHNVRYPYPIRSAKGIQYAPLHTSQDRKGGKNELSLQDLRPTPTANAMKQESTYNALYKEHLEPRVKENENLNNFSPGPSFVSRSPGHNVVYQNMPTQLHPRETQTVKHNKAQEKMKLSKESTKKGMHKITYRRPFPMIQNLQLADPTPVLNVAQALNPVYAGKSLKIENDRAIDSSKSKRQQSSVSSKLHRIHLNIARVYSPGQVPQKSPVFVDIYPLPEQAQALLLPGSLVSNKNTVMLPVSEPKPVIYKHM